jgi:hypothetical protein
MKKWLGALGVIALGLMLPAAPASAFVAGSVSPEPAPTGNIGVRLEPAPDAPSPDIRDRFYIVTHLNPGTTLTRTITAINDTDEPQHLELYAAAATIEDTSFIVGADRTPNDLTEWTTISPSTVDIPPGDTAPVEVTIRVPGTVPRGERYAVAWVSAHSMGEGQIAEINRVGIRMYVDIAPGGDPPSNFMLESPSVLRDKEGRPVVTVDVTNTGERALDVSGTIALTHGPGGLSSAPVRVQQVLTLAPGAHGQVSAVLDASLPGGDWTAEAVMASGAVQRQASFPVTVPASLLGIENASSTTPAMVWWLGLTGVGLAIAIGLSFYVRGRASVRRV